jgi:flagellar motor component MotA
MIVPSPSATLSLVNEQVAPLNGDHTEITQFASEEDNNYKTVAGILAQMVSELRQEAKAEVEKNAVEEFNQELANKGHSNHVDGIIHSIPTQSNLK